MLGSTMDMYKVKTFRYIGNRNKTKGGQNNDGKNKSLFIGNINYNITNNSEYFMWSGI